MRFYLKVLMKLYSKRRGTAFPGHRKKRWPSKHKTLLQRRCNVTTLQRRCNDVVMTLCVYWGGTNNDNTPASILYKSIAGRYRPISYPDGPITARYRFIKNAYWGHNVTVAMTDIQKNMNCSRWNTLERPTEVGGVGPKHWNLTAA